MDGILVGEEGKRRGSSDERPSNLKPTQERDITKFETPMTHHVYIVTYAFRGPHCQLMSAESSLRLKAPNSFKHTLALVSSNYLRRMSDLSA